MGSRSGSAAPSTNRASSSSRRATAAWARKFTGCSGRANGGPQAPARRRAGEGGSDDPDALRLVALRALRHLELDGLTLLEGLVAVALDGGVVHEEIRAAL